MASSPVFMWIFLTAFIWGTAAAVLLAKYGKDSPWARGAMVVFAFLAIQSLFWILAAGVMVMGDLGFAATIHWAFSLAATPWWVVSAMGLLMGVITEVRVTTGSARGDVGRGIWVSVVLTIALIAAYGLFKLLAGMVTSVTSFG